MIATRLPKMNKPTIIFGADVTHAATDDETAPSIAAVVATYASERNTNQPTAVSLVIHVTLFRPLVLTSTQVATRAVFPSKETELRC